MSGNKSIGNKSRLSQVWLIGGTSDSATIAQMLLAKNIPLTVTVATQEAIALYNSAINVQVGCLDSERMSYFCQAHNISAVIDASHPYASEVSHQAIAITTQLKIPYLRFERTNYQASAINNPLIIRLDSFAELLQKDYLLNQRVLLTVGCQVLPQFKSWQNKSQLFARILPKSSSLEIALEAGFTSDRLIAMRPPINKAMEKALWQQWQISLVITKSSGKAGGEDTKHQVASSLGIPLVIINRPRISYPQQTSAWDDVIIFCQKFIYNN